MKYIKKFERFRQVESADPAVKPAPTTTPSPTTTPTPSKNPERPSPLRRDRPSVEPDPLAKKNKKSKATEEAIANRFLQLADAKGIDFKKYYN